MPRKRKPIKGQFELDLGQPIYDEAVTKKPVNYDDFIRRVARCCSAAIKESPLDRDQVNDELAKELGVATHSRTLLDAYTSESKASTHAISLSKLKALVRVTGAYWVWQQIIEDDGLVVLEGEDAHLVEIARLEEVKKATDQRIKQIKADGKGTGARYAS